MIILLRLLKNRLIQNENKVKNKYNSNHHKLIKLTNRIKIIK